MRLARSYHPSSSTRWLAGCGAGPTRSCPGFPVTDTIKRVGAGDLVDANGGPSTPARHPDPQGFRRSVLEKAHADADPYVLDVSDDAGLVEMLGVRVLIVPGDEEGFKVTRPLDLVLAEAVLARRRSDGAN